MAVIIRRAQSADARALALLRYEFRSGLARTNESKTAFVNRCARWMRTRLARSTWRCWIALDQDDVVGSLWLGLVEKLPNPVVEPEAHGYLTSFYLRPQYRDRGTGSRMLTRALGWCAEQGLDAVILWPTAGSRSLYLRHGAGEATDILEFRSRQPMTRTRSRRRSVQ